MSPLRCHVVQSRQPRAESGIPTFHHDHELLEIQGAGFVRVILVQQLLQLVLVHLLAHQHHQKLQLVDVQGSATLRIELHELGHVYVGGSLINGIVLNE